SGDYFRCQTIRRASISDDGSFNFMRMSIVSTISLAPGRVRAKSSLHPECCNTRVETSSFGEDKGTIAGSDAGRKDLKQQKCIRPALSRSRISPVFLDPLSSGLRSHSRLGSLFQSQP